MNFVVEDGVGRSNANAYVDLDMARSYAQERHRESLLTITDEMMKALAVRATDYIEQRYLDRFIGRRASSSQALAWPRDYAYDDLGELITGVPWRLCAAVIELMDRANSQARLLCDPPAPYPVESADGTIIEGVAGPVVSQRKKVDVIETATTYAGAIGGQAQPPLHRILNGIAIQEFPAATAWLTPLLTGGGGQDTFMRY